MRKTIPLLVLFAAGVFFLAADAQPPDGKDKKDFSEHSIVVRMMAFNKKKDGKLTKEEVTDTRLHRLFEMADANTDGIVTREELMALAARLEADEGGSSKGFDDFGKFKGKGPKKDGKGPKGKGPPPPPE